MATKKNLEATLVEKIIYLDKFEIVKYQLMNHCFINKIKLNHTELDCLSYLGELGEIRLAEFTIKAAERGILSNHNAVNNCLNKLEQSKLFIKKGAGKKIIFLDPELKIQSEGNVIVTLKLVKTETNITTGNIQKNSETLEPA